jgi:hypothetical protein
VDQIRRHGTLAFSLKWLNAMPAVDRLLAVRDGFRDGYGHALLVACIPCISCISGRATGPHCDIVRRGFTLCASRILGFVRGEMICAGLLRRDLT